MNGDLELLRQTLSEKERVIVAERARLANERQEMQQERQAVEQE